jgi:hypothetical protein
METKQEIEARLEETYSLELLMRDRRQKIVYELLEWRVGEICRYLFRVRSEKELALESFDGSVDDARTLFLELCEGHSTPCLLEDVLRDRRLALQLEHPVGF